MDGNGDSRSNTGRLVRVFGFGHPSDIWTSNLDNLDNVFFCIMVEMGRFSLIMDILYFLVYDEFTKRRCSRSLDRPGYEASVAREKSVE